MNKATTVVQLTENVRAKGESPEQRKFREFLLGCLRACKPQPRWYNYWKRANALSTFTEEEQERFKEGYWFCSTNTRCAKHNTDSLLACGKPIVMIRAEHPEGGAVAKRGTHNDAMGLLPELGLCVGSKVLYKCNTWTSRGVVHGLLGEVIEIVYAEGTKPLSAPGEGTEACCRWWSSSRPRSTSARRTSTSTCPSASGGGSNTAACSRCNP